MSSHEVIWFQHGNQHPTIGAELEIWLVDKHNAELSACAPELLADLPPSYYKKELFRSMLEINTPVCQNVAELCDKLSILLHDLALQAQQRSAALLICGSHPTALWQQVPISEDSRYHNLLNHLAWPARQVLTAGLHIHVGVENADNAVKLLGPLRFFIPHLLALSSSSPYWACLDTQLASSRSYIFGGLPNSGLPPNLANWQAFLDFYNLAYTSESLRSFAEIWWDLRPHPTFGTIEFRVCDAFCDRQRLAVIAAWCQCLVVYWQGQYPIKKSEDLLKQEDAICHLPKWLLQENKWRAMRYGLQAQLIVDPQGRSQTIKDQLLQWQQHLQPIASALGCEKQLASTKALLQQPTSSQQQRQWCAEGNGLEAVLQNLLATSSLFF